MNVKWLRLQWDRFGGWLCIAAGALVLLIGWHGAAESKVAAGQIPYVLSGGIGGILLVAVGATLLISADLRDEWQKLDEIVRELKNSNVVADAARTDLVLRATAESDVPTPTGNGRRRTRRSVGVKGRT
jgi:hypothetical protein